MGAPSLNNNSVIKTIETYQAAPPTTEKQMINILRHAPIGTHKQGNVKYSYWGCVEVYADGSLYKSIAGCISVGGKIRSSCIKRANFWGNEKVYGDGSVFDTNKHPGMLKAFLPFFRQIELCRAAYQQRPVYFSPDGTHSYIPADGERFLGWKGNEAQVERIYTPAATPEPNTGAIILNALINAAVNATAPQPSVQQPVYTPPADNTKRNQEIIDYWNRKAEKAKNDYEYWRDVHNDRRFGFDTN